MSMKLIFVSLTLTLTLWLFMATSTLSQTVIDTNGEPLKRGKEYYIKPAITDSGGRFTLINRNNSCPLYVGLENTDTPKGLPVIFTPFAKEDNVIKVNRDFKISFSASTTCVQSTAWKLGQNDTKSGRRLIITGIDGGRGSYGNYFRVVEGKSAGIYNIKWCPTDLCATCRFICGTASGLREGGGVKDPNSKILLALDGGVLPVQFYKK